ncbi:hypothetical protein QYF61_020861, partial [Mycteria americana]
MRLGSHIHSGEHRGHRFLTTGSTSQDCKKHFPKLHLLGDGDLSGLRDKKIRVDIAWMVTQPLSLVTDGEGPNPHLATASFQVVVESDKVSPQPPFLQAKPPQFPQLLPISLVLQTLHQLRCPSLDTFQHLNVSLVVRGPKLNTVFEVRPHQCQVIFSLDHFSDLLHSTTLYPSAAQAALHTTSLQRDQRGGAACNDVRCHLITETAVSHPLVSAGILHLKERGAKTFLKFQSLGTAHVWTGAGQVDTQSVTEAEGKRELEGLAVIVSGAIHTEEPLEQAGCSPETTDGMWPHRSNGQERKPVESSKILQSVSPSDDLQQKLSQNSLETISEITPLESGLLYLPISSTAPQCCDNPNQGQFQELVSPQPDAMIIGRQQTSTNVSKIFQDLQLSWPCRGHTFAEGMVDTTLPQRSPEPPKSQGPSAETEKAAYAEHDEVGDEDGDHRPSRVLMLLFPMEPELVPIHALNGIEAAVLPVVASPRYRQWQIPGAIVPLWHCKSWLRLSCSAHKVGDERGGGQHSRREVETTELTLLLRERTSGGHGQSYPQLLHEQQQTATPGRVDEAPTALELKQGQPVPVWGANGASWTNRTAGSRPAGGQIDTTESGQKHPNSGVVKLIKNQDHTAKNKCPKRQMEVWLDMIPTADVFENVQAVIESLYIPLSALH